MAATTDTPTDVSYVPFRPLDLARSAALSCFAQVGKVVDTMPRSRSPSFSTVAPRSSWLQARARARLRATGTDPGRLGPDLAAPTPVPRARSRFRRRQPSRSPCVVRRYGPRVTGDRRLLCAGRARRGQATICTVKSRSLPIARTAVAVRTEPTPPEQDPDHVRTSSRPKTAPTTVSPGRCRCSCCTTSRRRICWDERAPRADAAPRPVLAEPSDEARTASQSGHLPLNGPESIGPKMSEFNAA